MMKQRSNDNNSSSEKRIQKSDHTSCRFFFWLFNKNRHFLRGTRTTVIASKCNNKTVWRVPFRSFIFVSFIPFSGIAVVCHFFPRIYAKTMWSASVIMCKYVNKYIDLACYQNPIRMNDNFIQIVHLIRLIII